MDNYYDGNNCENSDFSKEIENYEEVENSSLEKKNNEENKKGPRFTINLNLKKKNLQENNFNNEPKYESDENYEGLQREENYPNEGIYPLNMRNDKNNFTAAIMKQEFPDRYFILKNMNKILFDICLEFNFCITEKKNKEKLQDLYQVKFLIIFY